jgi:hypothetical protein
MSTDAKPGAKIVFSFPDVGHADDQKIAEKYLEPGGTYTVDRVEQNTKVYLLEVGGNIGFKLSHFSDAL